MRWQALMVFMVFFVSSCVKEANTFSEKELQTLALFKQSVSDNLENTNIDSTRSLARQALLLQNKITDSTTVYNALIQIGITHVYQREYDSGIVYYNQAYQLAKSSGSQILQAKALHWLADVYVYAEDYNEAAGCLKRAIKINREKNQNLSLATNYALYGHIFIASLQYDSSLAHYRLAEYIFDSLNDIGRKATVLSNIADVYRKIDDLDNARAILQEALIMQQEIGNIREIARIQNTTGIIFMNQQEYDSAVFYFNQAIPNAKSVGYEYMVLIARFNLGKVYSMANNFAQANHILEELLYYCSQHNIVPGQIRCLLQLGKNNMQTKNYQESKQMLEKGLDITESNGSLEFQQEFLSTLIKLTSEMSGDTTITSLFTKLDQIEDSISDITLIEKVTEAEARYNNLKKEKQLKILIQEHKLHKLRLIYTGIVISLLFIAVIFAIFLYRKRLQLLKQKHLLSEQTNMRKQLSLEKATLELQIKDNTIKIQQKEIQQKAQALITKSINKSRIHEIMENLNIQMLPYILKFRTKKDREAVNKILNECLIQYHSNPFEEIEKLLNEIHSTFFMSLKKEHPELTLREVQLCGLISLNLSAKDISSITSLNPGSINSARYTIRKKMNLQPDQNLSNELLKFQ